jgi:hypothetical protein
MQENIKGIPLMSKPEPPTEDIVRILRVYEFVGPRSAVEAQINHSIQGTKIFGVPGAFVKISSATIGNFAEILAKQELNSNALPL